MVFTLVKEGSKVIITALYKTIIDVFNTNATTKHDALQILDVKDPTDKMLIYEKYKDLYDRNENNSKYLQSKIKNAYLFLSKEK